MIEILNMDCMAMFQTMQDRGEKANLIIADPPFNIGYEYDQYKDMLEDTAYLSFNAQWMEAAHECSTDTASLWLCIGDDWAAELKVMARAFGWHLRQWCVWHFGFGVNCTKKFTRSHVHLLHFVKNKKKFLFETGSIRIPSKRAWMYNDRRAAENGRLPDDVWLFPRVAGTFKEREGFHGCQMPEKLIARMVLSTSLQGDLIVDPFCGSGTTPAVCKKLGRKCITSDISLNYVEHSRKRCEAISEGDELAGADEMVVVRKMDVKAK